MRNTWLIIALMIVVDARLVDADETVQKIPVRQASLVTTSIVNTPKLPTVAEITAQKEALAKNAELDEATKTALDQLFTKSMESLQATDVAQKLISTLLQELDTAATLSAELEKSLANISSGDNKGTIEQEKLSLEGLNVKIKDLETELNTAKQNLQQMTAEIERRKQRRPQLEDLKVKTNTQLQETIQQLTLAAPEGENPLVTIARQQRYLLLQNRLQAEMEQLIQESKTYEGTQKLWTLRHDFAELQAKEFERRLQSYQQQAAELRKRQAELEAKAARWQIASSHESVKRVAEKNSLYAEDNTKIASSLQQVQTKLDEISKELQMRKEEYSSLRKRTEAAEYSPSIGVLLRNQKLSLPDRETIRSNIVNRQAEIAALNLNLTEWQIERKSVVDIRTATQNIIHKLMVIPESISREDLEFQVQELLTVRLRLLGDMLENGSKLLDQLARLDSQESQLLKQVNEEREWLAEQVLWVRSTNLIGSQPQLFLGSLKTLSQDLKWQSISELFWNDVVKHTIWWLLSLLVMFLLLTSHKKIKQHIRNQGEISKRAKCTSIKPTLEAAIATFILAIALPLILWCIGWRLRSISTGEVTLQAMGGACQMTSIVWVILEFLRQVAQHDGLGASHFGWSTAALSLMRRKIRLMTWTLLPILGCLFFLEYLNDEDVLASIGRMLYLTAILISSIFIYRLFNPGSPIVRSLESRKHDKYFWHTRWIWIGILHLTPLILAILSISGYHYTATQLTQRVVMTLGSVLIVLLISSFLARWLLTTYRSLAIRRGQEKRQQYLQAVQLSGEKPTSTEGVPELGLLDINEQARSMLRWVTMVAFAGSVYFIWIDVLPALGFLKEISLGWTNANASGGDETKIQWVTAADLLWAILIGFSTLIASRNVPGLMEIAVWQRLALDAGARYAASTLSRYVIVVGGFIFCFQSLGIGWTSVQWLVAAMTVGLGFGLQEIFANFVSGIILLFERPIRVGDTVTIGDVTGTVSRIQIRATTITDWDNKELIVPNREFVTGNLVNWTLSNSMLRVVIKVGVEYGSDVRLVTNLLYQVAKKHPLALKEPEPFVAFTQFGDSSLNFELRLYVNGLDNYRNVESELHVMINQIFQDNNIVIAFPHQDINIRSLPTDFFMNIQSKLSA